MSTTPRPWALKPMSTILQPSPMMLVGPDGDGIQDTPDNQAFQLRAINAFDALLAVAKAAELLELFRTSAAMELRDRLRDLSDEHPGWRAWTP